MKVEIWSDIVCPWCYIGRRRFESALKQFEHADEVEVIWRSFELDPSLPRDYKVNTTESVMQKYGWSRERADSIHAHVTELAAQEGLDFRFDQAQRVSSFDAHRLIHLAAQHNVQSEMKERLQKAYFTEGVALNDFDSLVQLASEVGLNADETRQMLENDGYNAEVRADEQRAMALGINGVPFFVIDGKYGVSGAQNPDVFVNVLERAWALAQPEV